MSATGYDESFPPTEKNIKKYLYSISSGGVPRNRNGSIIPDKGNVEQRKSIETFEEAIRWTIDDNWESDDLKRYFEVVMEDLKEHPSYKMKVFKIFGSYLEDILSSRK